MCRNVSGMEGTGNGCSYAQYLRKIRGKHLQTWTGIHRRSFHVQRRAASGMFAIYLQDSQHDDTHQANSIRRHLHLHQHLAVDCVLSRLLNGPNIYPGKTLDRWCYAE